MEELKDEVKVEEEVIEEKVEEKEEPKVIGHKAEVVWIEKNIPRTRKLRNTFHKNEEVAENMALKTIEEYFENQNKENIDEEDIEVNLYPVYEEWNICWT